MKGNLLIAHGGGPTAVINASLYGVIREAEKHAEINGIYGARYGIEGVLREDFIDLRKESNKNIEMLPRTPASAIGSCRRKLTEGDYPILLEIFKRYEIRYFFYNGGNDSMDTCNQIALLAEADGYDMKVMGIPKTIDNDLEFTDHCPGYGSAARYVAISAMELAQEVAALPIHVIVLEVMGRNAGWLAAAAVMARKSAETGPHLIYLPERPFIEEEFLQDVKTCHARTKGILVVASEGLVDDLGNSIASTDLVDGFGHKIPGGVAQTLSNKIIQKLGIKSRAEKPGLLGRASIQLQSAVDREEAAGAGAYAVKSAVSGVSGTMVSIKRLSDCPYQYEFGLVALEKVANIERKFPQTWINPRGNGIGKAFIDYCAPLIGDPLPEYATLEKIPVPKRSN